MARITAQHALGDIWAMGATPQASTVSIILPRMSSELQQRTLVEIMQSAHQVMDDAGAQIVGGHTSLGAELTIGFTVTGLCDGAPITLQGGQTGDVLILTKPLGSGVILAAEMEGRARGAWVAMALQAMSVSQQTAARCLAGAAHAMTDVTGFGLAGHLAGLCEASGLGAEIDLSQVPFMPGAKELHAAGVRSSIFDDNRRLAPDIPDDDATGLLFDPQTSGGLLASVSEIDAERLLGTLRDRGVPAAAIGRLVAGPVQLLLKSG